ncbi:MAG: ABC transporter permease [Chlorobi bacterium]|nr:ABC transporter permease [Chlorobiota bacterium]
MNQWILALWMGWRLWRSSLTQAVRFILRTGIAVIAISITVIVLATAIVDGFKDNIYNNLFLLQGHLQIRSYSASARSLEPPPIQRNKNVEEWLRNNKLVKFFTPFIMKPALLTFNKRLEGVVVEAQDSILPEMVEQLLEEGRWATSGTEIVISKTLARKLNIHIGNKVRVFFSYRPLRVKEFTVVGIYHTGLKEYDDVIVFMPLSTVQMILGWDELMVSGYKIYLTDWMVESVVQEELLEIVPFEFYVFNNRELNPNLFDWLNLHETNKMVLIGLLIIVSVVNLFSVLITFLLERTPMIAMLSAIGATAGLIRRLLVAIGIWLLLVGTFIGNVVALALALIQIKFKLIKLPEEAYYVPYVPLKLDPFNIFITNLGVVFWVVALLLIASMFYKLRTPSEALRWGQLRR